LVRDGPALCGKYVKLSKGRGQKEAKRLCRTKEG
jgi:hypothetical protein